ncbi:ATP-dependent DNA helicase [Helcobacillus massiliensis]|uniref:DNA 5'-3' helicase n=1 Tax=Helcobacillus massiliensis TaxID=521392 RepID=A0A839QWR4_9MICO|nr:ATP-dependent DNA helicase [Helcobacillus massiliensis]MBB3021817.1 ATP-dependent DNA helicase DinG [Helcobacillus massiliensis]
MATAPIPQLLEAAVGAVGGEVRTGQRTMAEGIAQSLEDKRHLLVQAGTGTGKSLAYLVPALAYAVENDAPVVISTATIALQNQIVEKDLPRLVDALAPMLERTPSFSLLKGRSNYLCLHKIAGGYPDDLDPGALFSEASVTGEPAASERLGDQVKRLREWAEDTDTGNRDDLRTPVSDRAWRQVSVTGAQCLGAQCPMKDSCFAERNRAIAKESDIIVTNHALLAIDAFDGHGIIPEHDVVIIDEAHELAARVTGAVTETLSAGHVRSAVRDLRGLGVVSTALDDAGHALGDALGLQPDGRITGDMPPVLSDAITLLEIEARQAHSDAKDAGDSTAASTAGARKAARTKLQEIMDVCARLISPDEDDVRYISHSEMTGRSIIEVAPLSVASAMRRAILDQRTTVFTSATLALAGRFDQAAGSVGLFPRSRVDLGAPMSGFMRESSSAEREQWAGIDVGSPFDYPKQGILYCASQLPPPGREGLSQQLLEHLVELAEASEGGVLGLFSSRRAAETAADYVRAHTGLTVGLQGEDSLTNLVRQFREDWSMCLFGTLSLWQGVDVPGDACRLVVIDRIPFPRPDDPLKAALQERLSESGKNGFMAVSARHAALLMAQGAGRLIRTRSDRGMVAVLDSRLATRRYGSYLRQAMPPLWYTQRASVALGALERLAAAPRRS